MKTENEIRDRLNELMKDVRLTYPDASIQINAPLALIQVDAKATIHALEWVLGIPRSKFPLARYKKA